MIRPLSIIKAAGLGAGMMYFFDPISGNRRRSLVRDQLDHACNVVNKKAEKVYRDAGNRLQGAKAELGSMIESSDEPVTQRIQEGARNVGKTIAMRGDSLSLTAKGAMTLAGVGCLVALMNKRDLGALALGGLALAMATKEQGTRCTMSSGAASSDTEHSQTPSEASTAAMS